MTRLNLALQRLHTQRLAGHKFDQPEEVVAWLGAVQAQDYAAAQWAVAQRTTGLTAADLDQAFAAGTILRTHLLRPTWHFVTPQDIRWLLDLTGPRVNAANAYQYRRLELDRAVFKRSHAALIKALRDSQQLARAELKNVLQQAGIILDDLRFVHLMMRAELDGVVCSGARQGKQFTYALLDERVPPAPPRKRDEALGEQRYFTSRGPATVQDFVWWSGLTMTDARNGLEMNKARLRQEIIADQTYWSDPATLPAKDLAQTAYLLPNYDEYVVGYTDRSAVFDASHVDKLDSRGNILFSHLIVIHGQVVGTWKRTLKKQAVTIELQPFMPLSKADTRAVLKTAQQYGVFLELSPVLA